jgi:hypothetical protein
MVSVGSSGFEHYTEKNVKFRKFNTYSIDSRLLKLIIKWGETLNGEIINEIHT